MSATTPDSTGHTYETIGPDARSYGRYAQVRLEDSEILLYDRDDENAWITSDLCVALAETS